VKCILAAELSSQYVIIVGRASIQVAILQLSRIRLLQR